MLHKLRSRWTILAAAVILGAPILWLLSPTDAPASDSIVAKVKSGEFKVLVTTAGELRARKFVQIQGPPNAQQAEAYQMKISSLVPEGTVVMVCSWAAWDSWRRHQKLSVARSRAALQAALRALLRES